MNQYFATKPMHFIARLLDSSNGDVVLIGSRKVNKLDIAAVTDMFEDITSMYDTHRSAPRIQRFNIEGSMENFLMISDSTYEGALSRLFETWAEEERKEEEERELYEARQRERAWRNWYWDDWNRPNGLDTWDWDEEYEDYE